MIDMNLALDWTPNINHLGFFVAKELKFYEEQGIRLNIHNPAEDNYAMTPGKKLELDIVDFAIAPFETVISLNNKNNKVNAVAVFAILQEDLSSVVTLKSSNLDSLNKLDNTIYASYKARYEDHIVKQLVIKGGGKGEIQLIYPEKLGIWNTLLNGEADSTWIFNNWEGVEAESKKIQLNKFRMKDFGIPYAYSPILLTKKENISCKRESYTNFVNATRRGFLFSKENPSIALSILKEYITEYDKANIDLMKSFEMTEKYFGNEDNCGFMLSDRINTFIKWLVESGLENKSVLDQNLFTNELIRP